MLTLVVVNMFLFICVSGIVVTSGNENPALMRVMRVWSVVTVGLVWLAMRPVASVEAPTDAPAACVCP